MQLKRPGMLTICQPDESLKSATRSTVTWQCLSIGVSKLRSITAFVTGWIIWFEGDATATRFTITWRCLASCAQRCTVVNTFKTSVNAWALGPYRVYDQESRVRDEDGFSGSEACIFFPFVDNRPSRRITHIDHTIKRKPPKWYFTWKWCMQSIANRSKLKSIADRWVVWLRGCIGVGVHEIPVHALTYDLEPKCDSERTRANE
jgi:hypothetical protein